MTSDPNNSNNSASNTNTKSSSFLTSAVVNAKWKNAFKNRVNGEPAVLPVIHVMRENGWPAIENNIRLVQKFKFHGVFLINHGFQAKALVPVIKKVRQTYPELWIGANFLGCPGEVFDFMHKQELFGLLDGLWVDNGGIYYTSNVTNSKLAQKRLQKYTKFQKKWPHGLYFGGVDFKYQGQINKKSFDSVEAYIQSCQTLASFTAENGFMDCCCTTGKGTGHAADLSKMQAFRDGCGDRCRLSIASGVNPDNVASYLPFVDAILVATGISLDFHNFSERKMKAMRDIIDAHFDSNSAKSNANNTN